MLVKEWEDKQVVKSYGPFNVVDHGKVAWLDSWMNINMFVFSQTSI